MRNRKRDAYRFDEDDVARDGETVRRPMLLMDSDDRAGRVMLSDTFKLDRPTKLRDLELHRPGYRTIESGQNFTHFPDARRKKRDEDEDEPDFGASAEKTEDVRRPSIAARDAYVAGLQSAWGDRRHSPKLTSEPPCGIASSYEGRCRAGPETAPAHRAGRRCASPAGRGCGRICRLA